MTQTKYKLAAATRERAQAAPTCTTHTQTRSPAANICNTHTQTDPSILDTNNAIIVSSRDCRDGGSDHRYDFIHALMYTILIFIVRQIM